ncbi:hypothetical protein [Roseateles noduli]|uniref:hypothetical protein n=1 Tax=Roseateles noduli TaxID=2052484 RepID=UPI003D6499E5
MNSIFASAIRTLFDEYQEAPLRFLREINLQVRLGRLIEEQLEKSNASLDTFGTLSDGGAGVGGLVQLATPVFRIQHEMKVTGGKEASDIVVLKSEHQVRLSRAGNGTLDVVAAIPACDVEAVIEVKAACSADPEQRHLFRNDVRKLHQLSLNANADEFEMHFVLVDKSIPIGQHLVEHGKTPVDPWEVGFPDAVAYKGSAGPKIYASPQITLMAPAEEQRRRINVWDMCPEGRLRHRVCLGVPPLIQVVAEGNVHWKTRKLPAPGGTNGLWEIFGGA